MSDAAAEQPAADTDPDAWATACEEDLAAEKARRRAAYGPQPVSAADELRRLADTVADKVGQLGKPLAGPAGQAAVQGAARQFIAQARSVVEPVVERNPQFFDHLAAAGGELLAAYRSAVQGEERRWTGSVRPEDAEMPSDKRPDGSDKRRDGDDEGPQGPERIDLD
ncbi:DUF5304 domain-containing protein [Streptomyces sp. N2-109]|uniref:DUF5304 domain-containing protein n=1 Tax=Streptomyces gossypii TaxID=2883101 RepID=A0ABT2JZK5_9ACTN|nr:DUF5304 domain-containing protein [Streptomyces gossypii]MCT2593346.1 DUF5304 domain-containing protein [Streptomyces gossypii]